MTTRVHYWTRPDDLPVNLRGNLPSPIPGSLSRVRCIFHICNYQTLDCCDCVCHVDVCVPHSRQIDRRSIIITSINLNFHVAMGPKNYHIQGDLTRDSAEPGRRPGSAGAERGRGQRRFMREDEPGYRGDGYPCRVREYPRLRQIVGAEPIRGAAVGAWRCDGRWTCWRGAPTLTPTRAAVAMGMARSRRVC